ncbi:MAG: hypothetical protein JWP12_2643 [Bacteroidetes bacterium]|nr:hypothetical protein [Bacteroidota bacterium]
MIRVYLDWNVFSNLKRKKFDNGPFNIIYSIIKKSDKKLIFPYSSAHLQDLKRGLGKSKDAESLIHQDLEFLSEISKDHLLGFDSLKTKKVSPFVRKPIEYFNSLLKDNKEYSFDELFSDSDNFMDSLMDVFKTIVLPVDFNSLNDVPDKYGNLKLAFKNSKQDATMYNLLKDITDLIASPEKMQTMYKEARNSSLQALKMDTNPKEGIDVFSHLDKALAKAKINQSFQELVEGSLKATKKREEEVTSFDYFTRFYISLDTYGYYRDKKLSNLIDDATHAFYGSHCDYFVTDDDNTYRKAKAIYGKFGMTAIVCKSEDFVKEFYKANVIGVENSDLDITGRITETIENSFILMETVDDNLNPVTIHKIQYPIGDYFDRMQISRLEESFQVLLYRKRVNYSDFMFWVEVETIINKIVNEYRIDNSMKFEFTEDDKKISYGKGDIIRKWQIKRITIEIVSHPAPFGLCLRLSVPN